jgi:hypothetical protein
MEGEEDSSWRWADSEKDVRFGLSSNYIWKAATGEQETERF